MKSLNAKNNLTCIAKVPFIIYICFLVFTCNIPFSRETLNAVNKPCSESMYIYLASCTDAIHYVIFRVHLNKCIF